MSPQGIGSLSTIISEWPSTEENEKVAARIKYTILTTFMN